MRTLLSRLCIALATAVALAGPATAQQQDGVVMAASGGGNGEAWRKMMGEPFAAESNIPIMIVDHPNTEAAVRTSVESSQFNLSWVAYFQAAALHRDGLLETLDPNDFPELKDIPEEYVMKAEDGRLIGIPIQFQYYGIAVNKDRAKVEDFASWKDLADPKWQGQIGQGQAFIVANYDLVMLAKSAGGDEVNYEPGIPVLEGFTKNSLTILSSYAQGNTLLSRGEVAALPFYSARVQALKNEGAPVEIAIPSEGALALPYMIVVPKGAKNKEAYTAFLRYALKAEGQVRMFENTGYIPLNKTAEFSDAQTTVLGMPLADLMPKLYQPDYFALTKDAQAKIDKVEQIQSGR